MTMYHAKGAGKNGYKIFDDGVKQVVEEKLIIEQGIRECMKEMNSNYSTNQYTIQRKKNHRYGSSFKNTYTFPF